MTLVSTGELAYGGRLGKHSPPLSVASCPDSFRGVLNDRVNAGIRAGLLGGAVTAGVLVGLGLRHSVSSLPFELSGRAFLGVLRIANAPPVVAAGVGVATHFLWMMVWGVCFTVAAARLRGFPLAAAAALFVVFLGALSATVVPGALGAAASAALTTAQTIFFLSLLAGALIAGMWMGRTRV